jgi:uncharacterized protein YqfA (UPF0365 family)
MGFRDNDTEGTRYDPPAIGEFTGSYHDTVVGIHDRRPIYGIRPLPDEVVRNMQGAYSQQAISRVVQVQISTGAWINLYRSQVTVYNDNAPDPEAEAKKRAQEANTRRHQARKEAIELETKVIEARQALPASWAIGYKKGNLVVTLTLEEALAVVSKVKALENLRDAFAS